MMDEAIRIVDAAVYSGDGRTVLDGVNLMVRKSEYVRVLYAEPESRRTLARLIGGVECPDSGQVYTLGHAVCEMTDREAAAFRNEHIGYASSVRDFWQELTVLENVALPLTIRGVSSAEREAAASNALAAVSIDHIAHGYPRSLTIGEWRLATLARALVTKPEILLLDDVLAGLEADYADRFATILQRCWADRHFTVLSFTGDINHEIHTTKTVIMERGKIRDERE